jgi:hypothetical protein
MKRSTVFRSSPGIKIEADPSPNALTDEERAHIADKLGAGCSPRAALIRKLVRLCDQRIARIRELEARNAVPNRAVP